MSRSITKRSKTALHQLTHRQGRALRIQGSLTTIFKHTEHLIRKSLRGGHTSSFSDDRLSEWVFDGPQHL